MNPRFTRQEAARLIERAEAAATAAYEAATPTPMIVGTPKDPVASLMGGDGGGFDTSKPIYHVASGVCGFAWVNIGSGNTSFARHAKVLAGARPHYYGGMELKPQAVRMSQSMQRNEAACIAYADVLRGAGINAYMGSRMD